MSFSGIKYPTIGGGGGGGEDLQQTLSIGSQLNQTNVIDADINDLSVENLNQFLLETVSATPFWYDGRFTLKSATDDSSDFIFELIAFNDTNDLTALQGVAGGINIISKQGVVESSYVMASSGLVFVPYQGRVTITNLPNLNDQNVLLGWKSTISGNQSRVGYVTLGAGMSLSAGVLSASAAPGGANTQVQFNDGGAMAGDAGLTYNKTTNQLSANDGSLFVNKDGANSVGLLLRPITANEPYAPIIVFQDRLGASMSRIGNDYNGVFRIESGSGKTQFGTMYSGFANVEISDYVYVENTTIMKINTRKPTNVGLQIDATDPLQTADLLQLRDSSAVITSRFGAVGDAILGMYGSYPGGLVSIDPANGNVSLGDISGDVNSTYFNLFDAGGTMQLFANNGINLFGGLSYSYREWNGVTPAGPLSLTKANHIVEFTGSAGGTFTLPDAGGIQGRTMVFINTGSSAATINTFSGAQFIVDAGASSTTFNLAIGAWVKFYLASGNRWLAIK